jgi:hypothetical protein
MMHTHSLQRHLRSTSVYCKFVYNSAMSFSFFLFREQTVKQLWPYLRVCMHST